MLRSPSTGLSEPSVYRSVHLGERSGLGRLRRAGPRPKANSDPLGVGTFPSGWDERGGVSCIDTHVEASAMPCPSATRRGGGHGPSNPRCRIAPRTVSSAPLSNHERLRSGRRTGSRRISAARQGAARSRAAAATVVHRSAGPRASADGGRSAGHHRRPAGRPGRTAGRWPSPAGTAQIGYVAGPGAHTPTPDRRRGRRATRCPPSCPGPDLEARRGVRTAARILLEVGDGSAFPTAGHLAAYAGLAPVTRRSGSSIRGEHPPRGGNKQLKRALFLSAFAALADPPHAPTTTASEPPGSDTTPPSPAWPAAAPTSATRCSATAPSTSPSGLTHPNPPTEPVGCASLRRPQLRTH